MTEPLHDVTKARLIRLCRDLDASPCLVAKALVNLIRRELVEVDTPGGPEAAIGAIWRAAEELTPGGRCPR
jgi:hypothetical protein